ncbi:aryl-alcohol dehydrogenase-like predicted oxidoreductase [Bradyrhizobium sp. LM3.2]
MEYRRLGRSGLMVPALSLGTGTFGGVGRLAAWGTTDAAEARRLLDICLDAGVSMFDTANVYSLGESERVLGEAIKGRRDKVLISTKTTFRFGDGPNDIGSSRQHLLAAIDASLSRLGTDYIDLFQLHGFDAFTPPEEVLATLDGLVRAGKIRYVGVSNFSGWHLMKSLGVADKHGFPRYVANQTYYSLIGRDYEWELMPLGLDQGLGAVVWSPLGWGRLTGKIRRGQPKPDVSRLPKTAEFGPPVPDEHVYRVVEAIDEVAKETGKSVSQIALNWLLQRPTVSTLIIGARNETQLRENLGAVGWVLDQGSDRKARCREQGDPALSVLAPAHDLHRPQSAAGVDTFGNAKSPGRLRKPSCPCLAAGRPAPGAGTVRLLPGCDASRYFLFGDVPRLESSAPPPCRLPPSSMPTACRSRSATRRC